MTLQAKTKSVVKRGMTVQKKVRKTKQTKTFLTLQRGEREHELVS
jgi:hypothetical protein